MAGLETVAESASSREPPRAAPRASRERSAWRQTLPNGHAALLVIPLLAVVAGLVVYPLAKLTVDSLTSGGGLHNYAAVFESSAGRRALITTLVAAAAVSVAAALLGGLLAWYVRITRNRAVKAVLWLAVLIPFWMGTVVKNYAIVILLSAEGPLNKLLGVLGLGSLSILYTSTAVGLGMVYAMVPYAAFSLYGVFLTIDTSLLDAARGMGASRLRVARTVVLPLAMPGIVAATALVFAVSLGFYVTPVLLGGAQTPFMASFIGDYIFTFFDYPVAAAASVILLVAAMVTLLAALAAVGRERLARAAG
jgi:putative spermidine/putrescine transport system permease protein